MRSVLLVNRDPEAGAVLERDLNARGYDATTTHDNAAAMVILSRRTMDVVVADLGALGTNVLLEQVSARSPRTRAIVTSPETGIRDYEQAIQSGAVRVLRAPVRSPDMLHAIRSALELEAGFPTNLSGLSPIDVLLMAHHARRSMELVVEGWDAGKVFLEQGEVIHAISRDLVGEPALHRILRQPAGSLRAVVLSPGTPRTIARAFRPLLLDALRALGEGEP
jgi:DNA-binding response OmpR family regulator